MGLPEGYTFRKLAVGDYASYLHTLSALTTVGQISEQQFADLVHHWNTLLHIYYPHVIANHEGVVVAAGMLFVEKKLIHECGLVGHIEDIAVAKTEQGKKLGHTMITRLSELSKQVGCYKVILDCSDHNVGFYEKCGLKNEGVEMAKRF